MSSNKPKHTPSSPESSEIFPIFLKLPPENIVALKFTLESYEGLGILRTLDPISGKVVILALKCTASTVKEVISSIEEDLQIKEIPIPKEEEIAGDWLMQHIRESSG